MSTIDKNTTIKIAKLARLKLNEDEINQYTKDLTQILTYVEQLKEVNTDGVEPLVHGITMEAHFREDEAIMLSEAETKKIVACSEQTLYDQYKVPQVIGGE